MKIIALNGPAGSGKDTLASLLIPLGYQHYKFSSPLKGALSQFLPSSIDPAIHKDHILPNGLTVRQALISLSEDWVKPTFGQAHFGELLAHQLKSCSHTRVVLSDSRFAEELTPTLELGTVLVVRIYRPGHSFEGDSGSYYDPPCEMVEVVNDGPPEAMVNQIAHLL